MIYKNILGKQIFRFNFLESTNTTALEMLAMKQLEEGSVVSAAFQKAGKGLDTNLWESEKDKNLTLSFLLNPIYIKPEKQFVLNEIVSLAVADLVKENLSRKEVKIKWPNDVYVEDRKIAGILINNSINGNEMSSSVIGIGLNVNQTKFVSDAPNPVSLKMLTKKEYNLDFVLYRLCDFMNLRFRELMQNKNKIDKEYLKKLYRFEIYKIYKIGKNKVEARITGLDEYGKLCLETKDSRKFCCDLKEVKFVI